MADKKTLVDYEIDIPKVSQLLQEDADVQAFFDSLTTGYQREWARYIFGAKAEATKQRHITDMKMILKAGYKSKRAYGSRPKA
ncbi:YdeI/OmpD-associated family protein [Agrilactobacillus fermenti]|uniref:YdeI/OmpD-associated family protein n=1 Tax=Agrilactobacillus fermenti TaxID=2586909 RepID=UPI003A5C6C09